MNWKGRCDRPSSNILDKTFWNFPDCSGFQLGIHFRRSSVCTNRTDSSFPVCYPDRKQRRSPFWNELIVRIQIDWNQIDWIQIVRIQIDQIHIDQIQIIQIQKVWIQIDQIQIDQIQIVRIQIYQIQIVRKNWPNSFQPLPKAKLRNKKRTEGSGG